MLKALRGLVLAAGVVALPAYDQVDCPSEQSIDRYAETARDALSALDGLVPESQQRALENRYVAMSVLRWHWQGRDVVTSDPTALGRVATCLSSGACDAEPAESNGSLAQFPSDRLLTWARVELGCEPAPTVIVEAEAEADPVEPVSESDTPTPPPPTSDQAATSEVERDDPALIVSDSAEPLPPPRSAIEVAEPDLPELPPEPVATDMLTRSPVLTQSEFDDTQMAMRAAMVLLLNGNFTGATKVVRNSCYIDAAIADPAASCEVLFDVYDKMSVRADRDQFLAFADQLCTLNYQRGCNSLARYFGVSTTFEALLAAVDHYTDACDDGNAEACAKVSEYFVAGRTGAADLNRARDALERSCNLGRLASCQELADYYLRGIGGDVDTPLALAINAASCPDTAASDSEVCVRAADFVLINLEPGPEKDSLIRDFTQRACKSGHGAGCAWYADTLEFGIGGDIDVAAAAQARVTACDFGHQESCDARS